MERDEVEAIEVHIPEIDPRADLMVEQGQLDSQIAQQPANLVRELLAVADLRLAPWSYGSHMLCFTYCMNI